MRAGLTPAQALECSLGQLALWAGAAAAVEAGTALLDSHVISLAVGAAFSEQNGGALKALQKDLRRAAD